MPNDAVHLAESETCKNQAFIYDNRILGLQFHLESTRESVKKLFLNCRDEIDEGPDDRPFVQKEKEILGVENIIRSNALMKEIMYQMAADEL